MLHHYPFVHKPQKNTKKRNNEMIKLFARHTLSKICRVLTKTDGLRVKKWMIKLDESMAEPLRLERF